MPRSSGRNVDYGSRFGIVPADVDAKKLTTNESTWTRAEWKLWWTIFRKKWNAQRLFYTAATNRRRSTAYIPDARGPFIQGPQP